MKEVLPGLGDHVLVRRHAGRLERLTGDLLVLVRHHVHTGREVVAGVLLTSDLVDANLRVRRTTAEPGLRVRLVLAVAVTFRWTPPHILPLPPLFRAFTTLELGSR